MPLFGLVDRCECGRRAEWGLAKPIPAQASLASLTECVAVQGLLNNLLEKKAIRVHSDADRQAEALLRREQYLRPAVEGSTRLIRPIPLCRTCYEKQTRALEWAVGRAAMERAQDALAERDARAKERAARKAERAAKAAERAAAAQAEAEREAQRRADEAAAKAEAQARARDVSGRAQVFGLPASLWYPVVANPGHPWTSPVERLVAKGPSPLREACQLLNLTWAGVYGSEWVPGEELDWTQDLPADLALPDHFECPECGRWADAVEAAAAKAGAMAAVELPGGDWRQLFGLMGAGSIGPAILQRWLGLGYARATEALAAAERRGLLRGQGRAYVAVSAMCAPCYEFRASRLAAVPAAPPRVTIPAQLRFRVLQRDNFRCQYCGVSAREGAMLQVDHVVPYSEGGETTEGNLITACEQCNLGKSARPIISD